MTELSLLVIDLGDSCVVKVERGDPDFLALITWSDGTRVCTPGLGTHHYWRTFDEVRGALAFAGEKPVPRIEQADGQKYLVDLGPSELGACHDYEQISQRGYDALSRLAGKPLPIWEGGTWEHLIGQTSVKTNTPINIYRYTR